MTQEKLREILDKHSKWLNGENDGERANLSDVDLRDVDFRSANLRGADLRGAYLCCAYLCGADLRDVDFRSANLRGADLDGAVYTDTVLNLQCSEEGSFIAWKKLAGGSIAKLLIPEDAKRSSGTTRKCRASKAVVMAIYSEKDEEISEDRSGYDANFIYRVGETVYPDHWDEDRWNECSSGIHFFITRKEAEEY